MRLRTAYLHLGIEKTGTTTLQSFLANNRDALRQRGIAYLRSPGHANHLKLNAYALADDKFDDTRPRFGVSSTEDVEPFRRTFRRELYEEIEELKDCHKFVFSNEHCSARLTTQEEARRLLKLLQAPFDELIVVMYLREQADNMISSYATNMKNGKFRRPELDQINWEKFDYYRRVTRWSSEVGKSRMRVRIYDEDEFKSGDLIHDFLDAIDETWKDEYVRPSRKNTSLDAPALQFLRLFNEVSQRYLDPAESQSLRRWFVKYFEDLPSGPRLSFPPDQVRKLRDACAESNEKLAREFLGRTVLFPEVPQLDGATYSDPSAEEVMETLVKAIRFNPNVPLDREH